MVFSSIPPYFDPSNWQQQHPNHQGGNSGGGTQQPPAPPPARPHGGGTSSTIRPGSMAERARLANIPMPEGPLKCPRCESTNTKFCYFNNYRLSQPRYFCKICRRYWTRGGALRNVPVGGGCRKNKRRSKGSSSKSTSGSSGRAAGSNGSGGSVGRLSSGVSSGSGLGSTSTSEMSGLRASQIPPLQLMPPLQYLTTTDFGSEDQIGLNYSGNPPPLGEAGDLNFPAANIILGDGSGGSTLLSGGGLRLPQVQQFPFFGGSDPYPNFEGSIDSPGLVCQVRSKTPTSEAVAQPASVKMEDNNPELNLSRQFHGIIQANDQFSTWNMSSPWTDLSGFSSSSASNPP